MAFSPIGQWLSSLGIAKSQEYGKLMEATRAQVQQHTKQSFTEKAARSVGYKTVLPSPMKLRMAGKALKLYKKSGMRTIARGTGLLKLLPGV